MKHLFYKKIRLAVLILASLCLQPVSVSFACNEADNYTGCGSAEAACEAGDQNRCAELNSGGDGGAGFGIGNGNLRLLQPLTDTPTSLAPSAGIQIFFDYFNMAWPWVLGIAAGIGLLQALIGAVEIMLSGGSSGNMYSAGKEKIMWACAGLLMVGLAGFILRSLNPIFYN